jgi:hypothetical protein
MLSAVLVGAALFALLPGIAAARNHSGHHGGREIAADTGIREPPRTMAGVSMDQAIEMAQRRWARSCVPKCRKGRRVYVLRLLSEQGRVWTVRIDAETGSEI